MPVLVLELKILNQVNSAVWELRHGLSQEIIIPDF